MSRRALGVACLLVSAGLAGAQRGAADRPVVFSARIDTPIHPAAASYLRKTLRAAEREGAAAVVLGLSTPGGLLTSTREMASEILRSKVPVLCFVSPSGSQAASAGFFLLMACDVAAMAPGTNAGAASPVGGEGQDLPKKLGEKAEQDARAFVRSLASRRGRNSEKAEAAVISSASYTETEARDAGLVEIIARDVPDLLRQADGRRIGGPDGGRTVQVTGYRLESREMSGLEKLIGVVSHPNVAYILFLLGLMGLYFELSSPGAILPGIVGGIALVLALYAFSVLPVNLAGLALILFAIGLFVAEVKVVSHGLLAVGGAVALIAGSLLLFSGREGESEYRVDLSIIIPSLVLTLGVVGLLTWKTLQLRMLPATTGLEGMVGEVARVVGGFGEAAGGGKIVAHGEYWDSEGPPDLSPGEQVRIVGVEGLRLRVERRS